MSISDAREFEMTNRAPGNDHSTMVLLVDDQLIVAEAIRRALADQPDIEFHYCDDPAEAIAIAKHVRPTVILQDLIMPGVDGLELVRRYRADPVTDRIPIIVLSTKEDSTVKSEAFKRGANDYLVKLPDKIELLARLRYHSVAYLNHVQRDAAYRALRVSQKQLMEANLELRRLTNIDGLTGLSNRRHFDDYISAEWNRAMRTQSPLSILMVDVDHFKLYNDSHGHLAGDEVLKRLAHVIRQVCQRSVDLPARFGGEEFAVILPDTSVAETDVLGEKLCRAIETLHLPHGAPFAEPYVTVSIGGAELIPQIGSSFTTLIETADQALYDAKHAGRNCYMTGRSRLPGEACCLGLM